MKVEDKRSQPTIDLFKNLDRGSTFLNGETLWMATWNSSENGLNNAVRLDDGCLGCFRPHDEVTPVNAKVVIE